MILSAFERKDSPWVWLQFRRHAGEKKRYSKTRVRKDDPDKPRKVQLALAQLETHLLTTESETPARDEGWSWVLPYLRARYSREEAAATLRVYLGQWRALARFLARNRVRAPGELTRAHCMVDYVTWRTGLVKRRSGERISLNSAIGELKLLGLLMDEAIERGLAETNPARRLNLEREERRLKPEITDQEAALIYGALEARPVWMRRAFHIALQTGLRFSSTQIALADVAWEDGHIFIERPKGGRKRAFSIPIYPAIVAMLQEALREGLSTAWVLPAKERAIYGLQWTKFFREIGLPHLCFHCTRVTFITRGARAGIPESAMMTMVNHASKDVHRIYQRHRPSDALLYVARMALPQPPAGPPAAAATKRSRPRKVARPPKAGPSA